MALPYAVAIIQALAPTIIALVAAAITFVIARRQLEIARNQAEYAREKLRHDLYDRRYAIYMAFETMLRASIGEKGLGDEEAIVRAANIAAHQSLFILDAEMKEYLLKLNTIAFRKIRRPEEVENNKALPVSERLRLSELFQRDTTAIMDAADALGAKFMPYLKLRDFGDR